jgi:hypothetical protein
MLRTATLSDDGRYRYELRRIWGDHHDPAVFVMLNPSIADADKDDPTIRRCIRFAQTWQYGSLLVVNLYALISTDPTGIADRPDGIGGRRAEDFLRRAIRDAGVVVAAWGNHARPRRVEQVRQIAREEQRQIMCLGRTKTGAPIHPLARGKHRVSDDVQLQPYFTGGDR